MTGPSGRKATIENPDWPFRGLEWVASLHLMLAAAYKETMITVSRIKNGVTEGGPVTTHHAG